jgi:hypothetical protein
MGGSAQEIQVAIKQAMPIRKPSGEESGDAV